VHKVPHREVSVAAGQVSEYNLDGSERVEALLGSRFGGEWNEMLAEMQALAESALRDLRVLKFEMLLTPHRSMAREAVRWPGGVSALSAVSVARRSRSLERRGFSSCLQRQAHGPGIVASFSHLSFGLLLFSLKMLIAK